MAASTLVIETCTPHASIALVGPDDRIEHRTFRSDRNHNALLFEPLRELIDKQPRMEIGLVLVGSGPGSYSGTRVGIAAAQGVAIALGCPAVAVSSLLAVPVAVKGARCLAIGDARRGSFWTAEIENLRLLDDPSLCDATGFEQKVSHAVANDVPVFSLEDTARFPLPENIIRRITIEIPDATCLWRAWSVTDAETRRKWSAEIPQPFYLKPPHITPAKRPWLLH
jgi:tRNA threonylcarbamoyl adenosine modification protein YeaZ